VYKANRIFIFFLTVCILFTMGSASEGLPRFQGSPAVCAWYTNTGIANPFDRSFPENLLAMQSRGLYVYDSIDVFAQSNQRHLIHKHYDNHGGGAWDNWEIIDTNYLMSSSPAVFQRGPNDIIVAFKGKSQSEPNGPFGLIIMQWDGVSWTQNNMGTIPGGDTTDTPAITSPSPTPGSGLLLDGLDVFTTYNGRLMHKILGITPNWEDLGMPDDGPLTSAPAAASWAPNRIDVVARGYDNVYYIKSLQDDGTWGRWNALSNHQRLTSDPSLSPVPMFQGAGGQRSLDIIGRVTDGAVYATSHNPADTGTGSDIGWNSVGGNIASGSAPACINYVGTHATIFARGMDDTLWYVDYDLGCCHSPGDYVWMQAPDTTPNVVEAAYYLTGTWQGVEDGGIYYLRSIGRELWWYGEKSPRGPVWSNVALGSIIGDNLNLRWFDVPKGQTSSQGTLSLKVDNNGNRLTVQGSPGNFAGRTLKRTSALPSAIPLLSPGQFPESTTRPSGQPTDLNGKWQGNDHGTYYIRQIGQEIMWFGEQADINPIWANVAFGYIGGNVVNLRWVDVPKGQTSSQGTLTLDVVNNDKLTVHDSTSTGGFACTTWDRVH
jgi:hypothetical protein